MICEYKLGTRSGLDCQCEECSKIRGMLSRKELDGEIHIVGTEVDKDKLRR